MAGFPACSVGHHVTRLPIYLSILIFSAGELKLILKSIVLRLALFRDVQTLEFGLVDALNC
jgi:hypothetical protein